MGAGAKRGKAGTTPGGTRGRGKAGSRAARKHRVIFQPSGIRGEIEEGGTLLDAARRLGVDLAGLCGGRGTCGKCQVRIEEGRFEKDDLTSSPAHLGPPAASEAKFTGPGAGAMRLACASRVLGDLVVFVPEKSRAANQVVRKGAREVTVPVDPAVRAYFVQIAPPTLDDAGEGDLERLKKALADGYGLAGLEMDLLVLQRLQDCLRRGGWGVTATVWQGREIVKVEPGFVERVLGLAVDVGTTTVVGHLCDLVSGKVVGTESAVNPQVSCGEDVMSRITFAMTEPGGLARMQDAIRECVNGIIGRLTGECAGDGGPGGHAIADMTVVGNTAMHHILLGLDPAHVGRAPFVPALKGATDVKARDLGIAINPSSYVHVLPIEAGFVGADNVGVLIAEEPYNLEERVLIVDIGTNGELLLGNREGLSCASCATGPAFEGAQIRHGMRAAPGAIEKVRIDPATKEPRYKVVGGTDWHDPLRDAPAAKGICGSGVVDAVAELFKAGIIDGTGKFAAAPGTPRVRADGEGRPEYVLARAGETATGGDVTVTQGDVRAVQLAKGALYAGAKLMMRKRGVARVDRVILAGAFGSCIDRESALTLGMFPDCAPDRICAVGNAAGDGAILALVNRGKRLEAGREARRVQYLEIALDPDFQQEFLQAMHIPHRKDAFPHLKALLAKTHPRLAIEG